MPANINTQYRQSGRNNVRNSDHPAANNTQYRQQNGGYQQKRQYNNTKKNSDYWHKNEVQQQNGPPKDGGAIKRNDENAGPSNIQHEKSTPYYNRNDRYQARTPSASASISAQRGPLPDWDEVSEAATNAEAFDYMDLSEFPQLISNLITVFQWRTSI